jgi:Skp family chaperone for outer membrane proteins
MKKKIQSGLFAISLLAFSSAGHAADFKIATVDLRKVFDSYYKTIQANIANSSNFVEYEKQRKELIDSIKKLQDDWRQEAGKANDQAVPADLRAESKKTADDIGVKIQIQSETISNFCARTELKLRDGMVQHVTELTAEITNVMTSMAKKQGYTMVLDRTALTMTGNPLVLYTSGDNDLTEALIKELNSTAPPALAPETNKPADTSRLPATGARPPPATPTPR